MTTREQIIAAAKEAGFGDYAHEALTMFERFYDIAFNAGYQKASGRIEQLEAERNELKATIALYDKAMTASWPEGATGEAFDHWNAARKIIAKG